MKYPILATAFLMGLLPSMHAAQAQAPPLASMDVVQRAMPDGPVALVDGKPIGREDFLFLYKSNLARVHLGSGGQAITDDFRVKAGITTLAELIQREILSQLGSRRKIQVSQGEIQKAYDAQLEHLIEEFTIDGKAPTEAEILSRSGQTRERAMEDMYQALLVERAGRALMEEKGYTVTDKDAREFFESNKGRFQQPGMLHLQQIFVRAGEGANGWAMAEDAIKKAQARFKVGESFEGVARSVSQGRDAKEGGDMGMRPVQAIPPVYVEMAGSMEVGATSEPFKSDQGWHIIRLIAREGESDVPFDEAKDWIKDRLTQVRIAAAVEEFCQPILQDQERVQIFLQLRVPEERAASNS